MSFLPSSCPLLLSLSHGFVVLRFRLSAIPEGFLVLDCDDVFLVPLIRGFFGYRFWMIKDILKSKIIWNFLFCAFNIYLEKTRALSCIDWWHVEDLCHFYGFMLFLLAIGLVAS